MTVSPFHRVDEFHGTPGFWGVKLTCGSQFALAQFDLRVRLLYSTSPIQKHADMQQSERSIRILKMLESGRAIPRERFLETLEISPATFKRDLEYLRDRLNVPIEWSTEERGYRLRSAADQIIPREPLPGLWLDSRELAALLAIEQLLQQIEPRVLGDALGPIRRRTEQLLQGSVAEVAISKEAVRRVRVLPMHRRAVDGVVFERVAESLFNRRRLDVTSVNRISQRETTRILSPQRLVSYRDNWYLDAWCHLRENLRTFSLDALTEVSVSTDAAVDVDDRARDKHPATVWRALALDKLLEK